MNVLILGGAGFIGMNIAEKLSTKSGYKITLADNLFRGKKDSYLEALIKKENVNLIMDDFTEPAAFEQLEKDYDQFYMLASVVGVKYTEQMPDELIRINTALIFNTLEWLKNPMLRKFYLHPRVNVMLEL